MEIKVGDKFKGKVNGRIFTITEIDEKNDVVFYKCDGEKHHYGLNAFSHCLLDKLN